MGDVVRTYDELKKALAKVKKKVHDDKQEDVADAEKNRLGRAEAGLTQIEQDIAGQTGTITPANQMLLGARIAALGVSVSKTPVPFLWDQC